MGVNPLCWSDIDAFLRLTGTILEPWEISLIEMLDSTWNRIRSDKTWHYEIEGEEG